MDSTHRLDSSIEQTSYLLSFSPFRCSTSCLPHGVPSDDCDSRGTHSSIPHCYSLVDSTQTGLLYSKQTPYLLSFSPFRCSTSCLPHGLPSDDSDSRGTHPSLTPEVYTLFFYSKQTSYLLSFSPFRCSTSCGVDSTLRLDSSIASRHRIYSLSVPSGALPLVSHTECHLMTLTPETGLLYSKQTLYLLKQVLYLLSPTRSAI